MAVVPDINVVGVIPESILTFVGLILLLFNRSFKDRPNNFAVISGGGLLAALLAVFYLRADRVVSFGGMFMDNSYTFFLNITILLASLLAVVLSTMRLGEKYGRHMGEYHACMIFSTIGMMFLVSATNFVLIYVGLELMAISIYVLTCFTVDREDSVEAAVKYFLLGAFASAITVYGISMVYGVSGSLNVKEIAAYLTTHNNPPSNLMVLGVLLIACGFGFKVAMVPFHMWTPDVYEGAPTPVTAFMSVGPKIACIAAMIQIFAVAFFPMKEQWLVFMWVGAALTMTLGNVVALVQENVKRLLAYSGIAHVGYMLMAFAAMASGVVTKVDLREIGVTSILVYLFTYVAMNIGAFAIVISIAKDINEGENISDFRGLYKRSPQAAIMMTIFLLSLAGMPPTAGFIGKFWVFAATVQSKLIWLALIGVVNAVVSLYYYLKIIVAIYFTEPEADMGELVMTPPLYYASVAMTIMTLLVGVFPGPVFDLAKKSFMAIM